MIKVLQILIGEERYFQVNCRGWDGVEWGKAYFNATFKPTETDIANCVDFDLIQHTLNITTNDMDVAFAAGNGMEPEIKMLSFAQGKSVSVGDVFVCEDGSMHFVASFGFTEIEDEELKTKLGELINGA